MPAPSRPAGPVSPSDMLWKHELREQNASLLHRMNTLEGKMKEQERTVLKAEETAATYTGLAEDFEIVKNGIDQLETEQREFMSAVHKRLVDMDKEMGEFRKTQERVQKLMASYRSLDDSVTELSSVKPLVKEMEREVRGLKNIVDRKHVHEMTDLNARLEALELLRSQEDVRIRVVQEDLTKKWSLEFHALRTEVMTLKESRPGESVQHPYLQVPRSPETGLSLSPSLASHQMERTKALQKAPIRPQKDPKTSCSNIETRDTAQAGNQVEEVNISGLNTNVLYNTLPRGLNTPGIGPRKRLKLSHPIPPPKSITHLEPEMEDYQSSTQTPQQRHQPEKTPVTSNKTVKTSLSKNVPMADNFKSNKRPTSPTITSGFKDRPAVVTKSRKQANPRQKILPVPRARQPQPSQPTRRSRRGSVQATFYELGWDCTQQPQKRAGPVYDVTHKPLKTKPRRLPPVPDE